MNFFPVKSGNGLCWHIQYSAIANISMNTCHTIWCNRCPMKFCLPWECASMVHLCLPTAPACVCILRHKAVYGQFLKINRRTLNSLTSLEYCLNNWSTSKLISRKVIWSDRLMANWQLCAYNWSIILLLVMSFQTSIYMLVCCLKCQNAQWRVKVKLELELLKAPSSSCWNMQNNLYTFHHQLRLL